MIQGKLKTKIYQFYESQLSIGAFEKWIYDNTTAIENQLSEEDFITIIGHNFKSKFAKQEFFGVINHLIDWSDYETQRVRILLTNIINKNDNFGQSLMATYDLYCEGYDFFKKLALNGALDLLERYEFGLDYFEELDKNTQSQLVDKIHPRVSPLASEILNWVDDKEIKLTGKKKGFYQRYEYIDNRPSKSILKAISAKKDIANPIKNSQKINVKKWWEFWKK
ncbi:MAG: hypothetical protein AB8G86_21395 [Saprospiraceae bacterium]